MHDVVLRNGRVVDPGTGRDEVTDVAFADGKVAAIGAGLRGTRERDVSGCIVMPGNIDFHTHVYWGGTSISIDGGRARPAGGDDDVAGCRVRGAGQLRGFPQARDGAQPDADPGLSPMSGMPGFSPFRRR